MRIFSLIVGAFAALLVAGAVHAEEAAGDWIGTLHAAADLRLAVHIKKTAAGYEGVLDSLDQGANGVVLSNVKTDGASLSFDLDAVHGRYEGKWDAAQGGWVGTWTQGSPLPLVLKRGAPPSPVVIRGLDGDWDGTLTLPSQALRLALHIHTGAAGTVGLIDSIDQGAMGIPAADLVRDGAKVSFNIKAIAGRWEGELSADGAVLHGTWSQGAGHLSLDFKRHPAGAPQAELRRPQTPKPPFPYAAEDVTFAGGADGVKLAGTLTLPKGGGKAPAVILVAGSGPNGRNETVFGHAIFWVLADDLTRKGYAVLRYDKRGVGASTGDYASATSQDFARDAAAAVAFLRTRPEIDSSHIGLVGHSEGGLVVPIVAAADPGVAFVVLLAGPGVNGAQILNLQSALIAKAAGVPQARIDASAALNARIYAVDKTATSAEEARLKIRALLAADPDVPPNQLDALAGQASSDWFRYFLTYDPVPALRQVKCPVLVLNGEKDLQVPPSQNLPPIRAALAANPRTTIEELPGLNHLFQTAKTGGLAEYASNEETMSPTLLNRLSAWLATVAPPVKGS